MKKEEVKKDVKVIKETIIKLKKMKKRYKGYTPEENDMLNVIRLLDQSRGCLESMLLYIEDNSAYITNE